MVDQKSIAMQTEPRFAHDAWCCCGLCIGELQRWIVATNSDRRLRLDAENKWRVETMRFTILHQIEEAEREVRMREGVYPRLVGSGKMKQDDADLHLARMRSILKTLIWIRDNESRIKEKLATEDVM
jgi:hypothetical protein